MERIFKLLAVGAIVLTVVAWVFARALVSVGRWLDEREARRKKGDGEKVKK